MLRRVSDGSEDIARVRPAVRSSLLEDLKAEVSGRLGSARPVPGTRSGSVSPDGSDEDAEEVSSVKAGSEGDASEEEDPEFDGLCSDVAEIKERVSVLGSELKALTQLLAAQLRISQEALARSKPVPTPGST